MRGWRCRVLRTEQFCREKMTWSDTGTQPQYGTFKRARVAWTGFNVLADGFLKAGGSLRSQRSLKSESSSSKRTTGLNLHERKWNNVLRLSSEKKKHAVESQNRNKRLSEAVLMAKQNKTGVCFGERMQSLSQHLCGASIRVSGRTEAHSVERWSGGSDRFNISELYFHTSDNLVFFFLFKLN